MKTTVQYLDALARRYADENGQPASDYRISKMLGLTRSAVSALRKKGSFSDDTALKVAELLGEDPAEVALVAHIERAKDARERAMWESILKRLGGIAAGLLVAAGVGSAPFPADAATSTRFDNNQTGYRLCAIAETA